MVKPSKDRVREYRERQKTGAEVPVCKRCKVRQLKGELSRERELCSFCWRKTPEGRAENAEIERRRRSKKVDEGNCSDGN